MESSHKVGDLIVVYGGSVYEIVGIVGNGQYYQCILHNSDIEYFSDTNIDKIKTEQLKKID